MIIPDMKKKPRHTVGQIIKGDEYRDLVDKATKQIVQRLSSFDVTVSDEHEELIRELCSLTMNPWKSEKNIAVFPGECGFGKSTAIVEIVKILAEAFPSMGIIIVAERIETMSRMANDLGEIAIAYFEFSAEACLQGMQEYDRQKCRSCDMYCAKKRAKKEHAAHQVLIIANERLERRQVNGADLGELSWFVDKNGIKTRRSLMLIDEKPQISLIKEINENNLNELQISLLNIGFGSKSFKEARRIEEILIGMKRSINELTERLVTMDAIDPSFQLSEELKTNYSYSFEGDRGDILGLFASFVRAGGVVQKRSNKGRRRPTWRMLTAGTLYPHFGMKTIIFDATASIDLDYLNERYLLLDTPSIRNFSNLTLKNCKAVNLSKTELSKKDMSGTTKILFEEILGGYSGEMLLLTYKNQVDLFSSMAERTKDSEAVCYINYYGNVKGRNDNANADSAMLFGINHKSDAYYVAKALSHGIRVAVDTKSSEADGRMYRDKRLQAVFENDMTADLIQSIMRTRLRRQGMEPVTIYCFIKHRGILEGLQNYFHDCRVEAWNPFGFCMAYNSDKAQGRRISELIKYLKLVFGAAEIGTSIKKELIKKEISSKIEKNMGRDALGIDLKDSLVCKTLRHCGVTVKRHVLVKTERGLAYDTD